MKSKYFTEEHKLFRDSVRQFIQTEVLPELNMWEEEERIPRELFKRMGELGFLGVGLPEKYGGSEVDFFYSVILLEEVARSGSGGLSAAHGVHQYLSTAHLAKVGSEELKEKYIPASITGDLIGSLAISEPGAGSDVANIRTTAVRDGDHFIINGSKTFITNGVYGDFATVACKTDTGAGYGGISLIIIDQGTPGFTTGKLKKIGWCASDTGELFFDNVRVPVSNLVGEENQGFYYIMDSFQLERLVTAIGAVGGADYTLELTLKYMKEREAFGRPISKFQALRHRIADLASEMEAIKQFTYHTCWLFDQKEFAVKECSMAKLLTTELGKKVADECLQFFGGYGYMEEYPIARIYRDARVGTIVGGSSEIMREIIAKMVIDDVSYDSAYSSTTKKSPSHTESKLPPADTATIDSNVSAHSTETITIPVTAKEIIESLPSRFRPEKAQDYNSTFHFDISGENGGLFTVYVNPEKCKVEHGHHGEPNCVVKTKADIYEDVEFGRTNAQMAVMMGKIKISNVAEMMRFISLFKRIKVD